MNHTTWYKNPVGKLVYFAGKLADHVVTESQSEKQLIEQALRHSLPRNYSVIYLGVVDVHTPKQKPQNPLVFVSTSRLVTDKGIAELIQAFIDLNNPNTILKICGDGPDAAHFKTLAKGIENIEFAGHIDNVIPVLESSHVLVHPTYHEGFGLSLVEAEMCGLPIIASSVGSIPEIVQDGIDGILVPPKNIQALTDAMRRLAENAELRSAMGKNARETYRKKFQFDQIIEQQILPLLRPDNV